MILKPQTYRFSNKKRKEKSPGNKHAKRHLFLYKVPKKLSKWAPEIDPKFHSWPVQCEPFCPEKQILKFTFWGNLF